MNINSVMKKIIKGERTFINDHNGNKETMDGYVILESISDDGGYVCPIFIGTTFCLNYLYEDQSDNKLHLSTFSVGGIMNGVYNGFNNEVQKYNYKVLSRKIENYEIFKK